MALVQSNERFHLKIKDGEVGRYAIIPGDPGRTEHIAKYLDNPSFLVSNREFTTYTGTLLGEKVCVTSTGIGGPSAAICVEELVKSGVDTFIRVGTCGGINMKVFGGDLIIASAAIRAEGTSREYLPEGYPAVADFSVLEALKTASEKLSINEDGKRYHIGVVHSKDNFYGQIDPDSMPVSEKLKANWNGYIKCGCLASEMEAASLFSVAQVRNARAGAIFTALWNEERSNAGLHDTVYLDNDRCIRAAVDAIKLLIESDKKNGI